MMTLDLNLTFFVFGCVLNNCPCMCMLNALPRLASLLAHHQARNKVTAGIL